jgi:hypothetical protein
MGIATAVVIVLLIVLAVLPKGQDPYREAARVENTQENKNTPEQTQQSPRQDQPAQETEPTKPAAIDPSSVSTIDIQPLSLQVAYVKGIGGFEYVVKRSASGTQYVEFTSPQLVGTKCTNDSGAFASIIQNPSKDEAVTIDQSQSLDGTRYGLSLSDDTCTGDTDLLKKYQASFRDAFSLLKKTS